MIFRQVSQFESMMILTRNYTYKPLYNLGKIQSNVVFSSLQSVQEMLHHEKYKGHKEIIQLLELLDRHKELSLNAIKRHPLIVLEGLNLTGKSTVTRVLGSKLNVATFTSPPCFLSTSLRYALEDKSELRNAVYSLGNYLTAFKMLQTLEDQPVILDAFWHSTAAFSLAQAVLDSPNKNALPPKGSPVYNWPSDLLKPDRVLLLSVSEEERDRRHNKRKCYTSTQKLLKKNHKFRQNVLLAYSYMKEPSVEIVNADSTVNDVCENILKITEDLIKAPREQSDKL